MKIGMLVTSFPVAAQPFILNQIIGLLQLGHEVDIYSLCDTRHELSHPDVDAYDLQSRVTYLRIHSSIIKRLFVLIGDLFVGRLSLHGLRSVWSVRRLGAGAITLRFYSFLWNLRRNDYDVFYAHYLHNAGYAAAARLAGMARYGMVEGHGTVYATEASAAAIKRLFSGLEHVVTVSEDIRQRLCWRGGDGNRITVIHTGINLDRFQFAPGVITPGQPCKLLCTGRLVPVKGHRYAIAALADVRQRGIEATLTLVGGGPCHADLVREAARLGVTPYVRFIDLVTQDKLLDFYRDSTMLLHPSITLPNGSAEGIPSSIMEAMALGLPVVAFGSGGIPELVRGGETGMLVAEAQAGAMAGAVVTLLRSDALRTRLVQQARREIELHYSQDGVVRQLERRAESRGGTTKARGHEAVALR